MPVSYSAEVAKALSTELRDVLADDDVPENVAKFLVDKNIVKLGAFADLADSKSNIAQVVGQPAGLDPNDSIARQPLKSARRQAEAETKAELEAAAKGDSAEKDISLGTEQRERLDAQVKEYYHFVWPAQWLPANGLMGKLERMHEKHADFAPRLEVDVKSIFEKEVDPLFKMFFSKQGGVQAQAESAYAPVQGLTKFRERHFQLMIAYNQAAAPEFENASLTVLLEYHQWLMEKIMDVKWSPEIVRDFLKADFRMRTKWILSWQRREFTTSKDVITHHRGQSAYLFSDAGDRKRPRSESQPRGRARGRGQGAQTPRDEQPRKASKPGGAAGENWLGLERTNKKTGQTQPRHYNGAAAGGPDLPSPCAESNDSLCDHPGRKHSAQGAGARMQGTVSDSPQAGVVEQPSRRRLRARIGRAPVLGEQPRGRCFEPLIQQGCGPEAFLEQLPRLQHPAASSMLDHLDDLHSWRETQMQPVRDAARRLTGIREQYAEKLHPDVHKVIAHRHLPLLEWTVDHAKYSGTDYVAQLMRGEPCLGEIPPSGVFTEDHNRGAITIEDWIACPRERNERMIRGTRSSGGISLDQKAWEKTLVELSMGFCEGSGELAELDLDRTCLTPRWPKWELKEDGAWKCRNISDWKASGGNDAATLCEKYSPEDLSSAHAVVRILRDAPPNNARLQGFRIDWEMAFRQDPLWPGHAPDHYELVWDPQLERVQWARPLGGTFGNKAAQTNFPEHAAKHSHALVLEIMGLIGWRYDKSKSKPPCEHLRLLGVEHRLGLEATAWLCEAKIDKLLSQIRAHRATGGVTAADASTLHGSFNWARSSLWGRCGAAVLAPLRARQRSGNFFGVNSAMLAMFRWLEGALVHDNRSRVLCDISCLPLVVTISDGEGSGNVAVAMWQPAEPAERPRISATRAPENALAKWAQRASNTIAPIEGVGPLLALATWPGLEHRLWIHFIDNTDAMHALIKGNSVSADLNNVMHGTWKIVHRRRLHLWVEYVNTHDNPVDKASRGCTDDLYDQGWVWDPPGDLSHFL
ncbi:unnamed protein product [Prorocentrum cordatum]|uniref:Uncharacterized protein n=1 Tax=Prorocentrum cordatum TaxID=2364126 RepID=A0ABN9QG06_9DINO|nr:unnamed protein product [Polarella glacialis]